MNCCDCSINNRQETRLDIFWLALIKKKIILLIKIIFSKTIFKKCLFKNVAGKRWIARWIHLRGIYIYIYI